MRVQKVVVLVLAAVAAVVQGVPATRPPQKYQLPYNNPRPLPLVQDSAPQHFVAREKRASAPEQYVLRLDQASAHQQNLVRQQRAGVLQQYVLRPEQIGPNLGVAGSEHIHAKQQYVPGPQQFGAQEQYVAGSEQVGAQQQYVAGPLRPEVRAHQQYVAGQEQPGAQQYVAGQEQPGAEQYVAGQGQAGAHQQYVAGQEQVGAHQQYVARSGQFGQSQQYVTSPGQAGVPQQFPVRPQTSRLLEGAEDYDPNPQYQFAFDVKDDQFTNYQNRKEQREGDKISGSYSVVDSDGFIRTVKYTADPREGFKAEVTREPTNIVIKLPTASPVQLQQQPQQFATTNKAQQSAVEGPQAAQHSAVQQYLQATQASRVYSSLHQQSPLPRVAAARLAPPPLLPPQQTPQLHRRRRQTQMTYQMFQEQLAAPVAIVKPRTGSNSYFPSAEDVYYLSVL